MCILIFFLTHIDLSYTSILHYITVFFIVLTFEINICVQPGMLLNLGIEENVATYYT